MSISRPPSLESVFTRSERMVGRPILDDYVLVPIVDRAADADGIYDLNPLAAFIWGLFDGRRDGHAIVAALIGRYEVDQARAERDYLGFVDQLLSIGALTGETAATRTHPIGEER